MSDSLIKHHLTNFDHNDPARIAAYAVQHSKLALDKVVAAHIEQVGQHCTESPQMVLGQKSWCHQVSASCVHHLWLPCGCLCADVQLGRHCNTPYASCPVN